MKSDQSNPAVVVGLALCSFGGSALLILQTTLNSRLSALYFAPGHDGLRASWTSFLVGTLFLFAISLCILASNHGHAPMALAGAPWYLFQGGFSGSLLVTGWRPCGCVYHHFEHYICWCVTMC